MSGALVTPTMEEGIFQVLKSVKWLTIKPLVFSGNHIDDWSQLWAWGVPHLWACGSKHGPRPLQFGIVGTGGQQRTLLHSSALVIHQPVCLSALAELSLKGVGLDEDYHLDLILEAVADLPWSLNCFITVNIGQN